VCEATVEGNVPVGNLHHSGNPHRSLDTSACYNIHTFHRRVEEPSASHTKAGRVGYCFSLFSPPPFSTSTI
jgi:hypothetical protein